MLEAVKRLFEEGNHFFLLGKYKLAIEYYNQVLGLNPNYEAVKKQRLITYCAQVQELFDSENYSSAIHFCKLGLNIYPENESLLKLLKEVSSFTENKNTRQVATSIPASLNAHEKQADQFTRALAIMAKDVYIAPDIEPKPNDWMPLPAGWERFYTYNEGGCCCAAYLYFANGSNIPSHMVFAYRGTVTSSLDNLLADYGIINGKINDAMLRLIDHIILFREQSDEQFQERFKGIILPKDVPATHTGHSLGAVLAQLYAYPYPAITFDNPGAKNLIIDYATNYLDESPQNKEAYIKHSENNHITILADVHAINTCQPQLASKVWRLTEPSYDFSGVKNNNGLWPSSRWWFNAHYLFDYSFDKQHAMKGIRDNLLSNGTIEIAHYPSSLASGYAAYLNPERDRYWYGYSKEWWATHLINPPENTDCYYPDFKEKLRIIWEKAVEYAKQADSSSSVQAISSTNLLFFKPKYTVTIEPPQTTYTL